MSTDSTHRPLYHCERCDSTYTSYLAALDCADMDALEDADRKSGRLFSMHRD